MLFDHAQMMTSTIAKYMTQIRYETKYL